MTSSAARFLRPLALAASLAAASITLSACAPLLVGTVAGSGLAVATDRRTAGTQLEDQNISFKVESEMRKAFGDTARVNADTYLGRVLLLGEVPDEASKQRATELANKVENTKEVVNQLRVGPTASLETRTSDTWITSKVRTALINTRGVPSRTISISTSQGSVYLMGKVTRIESDMAAAAAAEVSGVKQVVKVFSVMSREEEEELARSMEESGATNGAPSTPAPVSTPSGTGSSSQGVEIIPID